jgi:hypothetical protein
MAPCPAPPLAGGSPAKPEPAGASVVTARSDDNDDVRRVAAEALAGRPGEPVTQALLSALTNDGGVRRAAARATSPWDDRHGQDEGDELAAGTLAAAAGRSVARKVRGNAEHGRPVIVSGGVDPAADCGGVCGRLPEPAVDRGQPEGASEGDLISSGSPSSARGRRRAS